MRVRPLGLTTILILLLACNQEQTNDTAPRQTIRVGAIMALSGDVASYGQRVKDGIDMAVSELNGVPERPRVEVIFEDNQADSTRAVTAFQKLCDVDKVPMVLGPMLSTESLATAPLANQRKVIQLSTLAGTPKLSGAGPFVFRLYPSDEFQGVYLAQVARERFKSTRAAIIYLNNAYGQGIRAAVHKAYVEKGGLVVADEAIQEGAADFRPQIAKVRAARPDIIFGLTYYNEGGVLLRQLAQQSLEVPVLGGDAWYGPVTATAGPAVKLLTFSSVAFGPEFQHGRSRAFIQNFLRRYKRPPDSYNAAGYDAVYLAYDTLTGSSDAEGRARRLRALQRQGALGEIRFNAAGDNIGSVFALFRFDGDKAVPVAAAGN